MPTALMVTQLTKTILAETPFQPAQVPRRVILLLQVLTAMVGILATPV